MLLLLLLMQPTSAVSAGASSLGRGPPPRSSSRRQQLGVDLFSRVDDLVVAQEVGTPWGSALKSDDGDSQLNRLGPGPRVAGVPAESCGNPSTWLPELKSCETWVRTNPLAGLSPLPKPHWGWGFDPGYIDTAGKPAAYHDPARNQTAVTMRALLTDLARITGSLSADIGCSGPDCNATEATRMRTLVEVCTAAMKAHGTRQPQLSIRLSPWYVKFKGGHDPCSTDGEAAELQRLRTSLTHLAQLLADANQASGTNITFGAILVDSELFTWGPSPGGRMGVPCITRKNELVYNLSKECWPTAEVLFYDYGSTYYTPQGCGRNTSRADKCFNLSPTVPMGFDMELHGTFEESFAKTHPFTVSLYNIAEPLVAREKFKYTVSFCCAIKYSELAARTRTRLALKTHWLQVMYVYSNGGTVLTTIGAVVWIRSRMLPPCLVASAPSFRGWRLALPSTAMRLHQISVTKATTHSQLSMFHSSMKHLISLPCWTEATIDR